MHVLVVIVWFIFLVLHPLHYSVAWLSIVLYLASDMGLHYLIFMERNLENRKKKLTLVRVMHSSSLNRKNIVNNVGICSDIVSNSSCFREQ